MDMCYSLVVRSDESLPMLDSRMFEGTSSVISSRFTLGKRPDLVKLAQYPVILTKEFQEGDTSTEAVIGYMDEPSMNPRVSCPVLRFPASALMDRGIVTGRWGGSRTRWEVIEGDPYRRLAGIVTRGAHSEGRVVNERQAAVMMPFKHDPAIDPVYQAMRRGAADAGLDCIRVDQLMTPTDITDDIRKLIAGSRVVIADLTGMNLNVIYELGFSHGCGKDVILVSSGSLDSLPFDIGHQRIISYQTSEMGLDDLSAKVSRALVSVG